MIEVLSPRQLEAARPAGRFVGTTLAELRRRTEPGTNLLDIDRWVPDAAISFVVGDKVDPEDQRIIDATRQALVAGIAAAGTGTRIGDISAAIGGTLIGAGYAVNSDFGGHGVGSTMHQDPHVPNNGLPGRGYPLKTGLLLAIEPWVMRDTDRLRVDDDGWTLRSATGCRTAHAEHTIALTPTGPEILTLADA
jgi:methionyl aminopeptidase